MATFLITQATGQQGQQVVKHLLAAGAKVHAVVRNLEKVPPVLKEPGVTLFQGESKNLDEVVKAAQGCQGAYLNTVPFPALEILQTETVIAACKKAGVPSLVACTAFKTEDKSFWDDEASRACGLQHYYNSKAAVENAVRNAGFESYTILRPAVLIQDLLLPGVHHNFPGLPTRGELDHPFNEGAKTALTDTYDVGRWTAAALLDPAKFNRQEIALNNESLTVEEIHAALVKVSGKNVGLRKRTPEEIEQLKSTVFGQAFSLWSNVKDFGPDALKAKDASAQYGIPFTSLEEALTREKARLLECLPASLT